jgi:hypothetical protein
MEKQLAKNLGLLVIVTSIIVMLGWIFDIGLLKSILPGWVSMKFSTAFSFLMSGFTLVAISYSHKNLSSINLVVLSSTTLILLLVMTTLLISSLLGFSTGIEGFFVQEVSGSAYTSVPGRPSIGTMAGFIMMALAGLFTILRPMHMVKSFLL